VGERKCVFDGCNALEFRTSGFCLRHKDGRTESIPLNKESEASEIPESSVNTGIDETKMSTGFGKGFFYIPLFLATASLLLQDLCSVWLFFGAIIPPISFLSGRNKFSKGFALGSLVGILVFFLPWFFFTLATDLICYDLVWSRSC
jgi:hypothetical protein